MTANIDDRHLSTAARINGFPAGLQHGLDSFGHAFQTAHINDVDPDGPSGGRVDTRSHDQIFGVLAATVKPIRTLRNRHGDGHVVDHTFIARTKGQHAPPFTARQPINLFRHHHKIVWARYAD